MSKARDIADLDFNSPDIDGGNIDGAVIGGTTPAAGSFTALTIDTMTLNASSITGTSNLTLDVTGNINLDADGGSVFFKDAGTEFFKIRNTGSDVQIYSARPDADMKFEGVDGSVGITALLLDMSDAGTAIFNHDIKLNDNGQILFGSSYNGTIGTASGDLFIGTADANILFYNGSSVLPANSAGGARDNAIDLGSSSARFKDLFLSGNIALTTADNASAANMFVSPSTDFLYLEHPANGMIFRNTSGAERLRITSTGGLTHTSVAGGHVRFNSGVIDSDFTVSSGQYSHIFHVDGGNNSVSFGTSVDMGALVGIKPGVSAGTMYDALVLAGGANSTQGSGARLYISGCANDPIARGTIIEGKMTDNGNSHELAFYTSGNSQAPTKKMSITSGGDVLVGTTSTIPFTFSSGTGAGITSGGTIMAGATAEAGLFNRVGSDGAIIQLYKAGGIVGSIGVQGSRPYFGNSINFSIKCDDANSGSLVPANQSGVPTNNVADIGLASNRWNDLYLGGGVYLGGTGSANKLEDYEEGSWTPTLSGSGGTSGTAYTTRQGSYTKIGNTVTANFHILLSNEGQLTGTTRISGLPFSGVSSPLYQTATLMCGNTNLDKDQKLSGMQYAVNAFIYLMIEESDVALSQASGNGAFKNNTEIAGSVTYFTNS
jgi:hypothetical protein